MEVSGVEVLQLLDSLEEVVTGGVRIPLTGRVMVNLVEVLAGIDRLRSALPDEIRQARWVSRERERMLQEAEAEAKRVIEEARSQAALIVHESELLRQAQQEAATMLETTRQECYSLELGAVDYADKVLVSLENRLEESLRVVKNGRLEVRDRAQQITVPQGEAEESVG